MTARPDPASFDLSLGRARHASFPTGDIAPLARKLGVFALLVGGFLMVPPVQERSLAEGRNAASAAPAMVAADLAARQQSALLIQKP